MDDVEFNVSLDDYSDMVLHERAFPRKEVVELMRFVVWWAYSHQVQNKLYEEQLHNILLWLRHFPIVYLLYMIVF